MSDELIPLSLPGVECTRVGAIFPEDTSPKDWLHFGNMMVAVEESSPWLIGDWYNFGLAKANSEAEAIELDIANGTQLTAEPIWGARVRHATAVSEYLKRSANTIRVYGKVCSLIPFDNRLSNLSYKHHQEVAYMEPSKRDAFLAQAAESDWSVADLRQAIAEESDTPHEKSKPVRTFMGWALEGLRLLRQRDVLKLPAQQKAIIKQELEPIVQIYNSL